MMKIGNRTATLPKARVLIIDDDEGMCYTLSSQVIEEGHEPVCTHTLKDGLQEALSTSYDLVFLDVMLPDGNGLDILPSILKTTAKPEVIIITAQGNPEGAELAIRKGAWDYLQKPFSLQEVRLPLLRALQYREAARSERPLLVLNREGLIGESPAFRQCLELVGRAAQNDNPVLITGETGTGKELFATAIHTNSQRRDSNFVVVDCAALPETLVESVLFGHEKGAFTGADKSHAGLLKQADGGTLFLDEVGELPLSIQKTFLRVLQEHRFRPVGGAGEVASDFRIISATNRDLEAMVRAGKFRQDLMHRIQSLVIDLPPLRERIRDIRELAMAFMNRYCERYACDPKGFSPEFLEMLTFYDWPGNIRELENCMNSCLATAREDPVLFPKHLPIPLRVQVTRIGIRKDLPAARKPKGAPDRPRTLVKYKDYREKALSEAEKQYLGDLMILTQGQIRAACTISGLSQSRLYALLKKHQVVSPLA